MAWSLLVAVGVGLAVGALLASNFPLIHRLFDLDEFWAGIYRGSKGMYGEQMPLKKKKKK